MKAAKVNAMVNGWFIGNFEPSLCRTNDVEAAVKQYRKGSYEEKHYHKIATEYTVIVNGRARMFDREWEAGDIIVAEPFDCTDFLALEDCVSLVVKIPGANHDKYMEGE